MTEWELFALYKQRSQRTIQETEAAYGRYLPKVAGAVLPSREDVEECLNDTRPRVQNSIPPEKPKYFRAYLSRIAKNLALSPFWKQHAEKRCSKQYQLALDELDENVLPADESIEEVTDKNHPAACIDRSLEKLPKTRRIPFVRRYFYTDPTQKTALRQGMSESVVKMSLYQICKNLVLVSREEELF